MFQSPVGKEEFHPPYPEKIGEAGSNSLVINNPQRYGGFSKQETITASSLPISQSLHHVEP